MRTFRHKLLVCMLSIIPCVAHAGIVNNVAPRTLLAPPSIATGVPVSITGSSSLRDDCDNIVMRHDIGTRSGSGSLDIILDNRSPWWKELQLFINGVMVDRVRSGDFAGSTRRMPIFPGEFDSAVIAFVKPKAFGVETRVYQFLELGAFAGQTVTFSWVQDRCG